LEIFSSIYNKPIETTSIRPGEKLLESLISETQSYRLVKGNMGYSYIKPSFKKVENYEEIMNYNSKLNPLTKTELYSYLNEKKLLSKEQSYF